MADAGSSTKEGAGADPRRILFVLLVTVFMTLFNVNIINVTLPSIEDSLGASDSQLQWIVVSYALAFGVLLIPAGRFGDVIRFEGLYALGVTLFIIAAVWAALAPTPEMLLGARTLQGISSGIISPQTLGMIQHLFPGPSRARALALYGTTVAVSMGSGPLIGGGFIALLGPELGWRAGFLFSAPIGATALILAHLYFRRPWWRTSSQRNRISLDMVGILFITAAVATLIVPFTLPTWKPTSFFFSAFGLLLMVVWYIWEKHYIAGGRQAMVDVRVFSVPEFRSGIGIAVLYFFGATSIWIILALYLIDSLGMSALQVGLIIVPSALAGVVSSQWAGRRIQHRGPQILRSGLLTATITLAASGAILAYHVSHGVNIWWLLVTMVGAGVGQGIIVPTNQTMTLMKVPEAYSGSIGGVLQTAQRIGSVIGIAITTGVFFSLRATISPVSATVITFGIIGASYILAAILSRNAKVTPLKT